MKRRYTMLQWAEHYFDSFTRCHPMWEKNMWLYLFFAAEAGEI